jgi:hypothetical protein
MSLFISDDGVGVLRCRQVSSVVIAAPTSMIFRPPLFNSDGFAQRPVSAEGDEATNNYQHQQTQAESPGDRLDWPKDAGETLSPALGRS